MSTPTEVVLDKLVHEFRCPYCKNYMHPPIRQCSTGHNYCHHCHQRMRVCPTCQQALRHTSRAFVLEKLHSKLSFPCRFSAKGCHQKVPGPLIQRHEYSCKFGLGACPLKRLSDCKWHGRSHQLISHCLSLHRRNVFLTNVQRLTCTNFVHTGPAAATFYFLIFYAFHEFFKCVWEVDFDTGIMRWCVFRMITDRLDTQKVYDFIIEIYNYFDPIQKLVVKGACPSVDQNEECEVNNVQFVVTHYDMVKKFCKGDELPYVVKIFPRNVARHFPH